MKTRQISRKRITLPGRYSTVCGTPQDVDLRDLSCGGCRIEVGSKKLSAGQPLQIYVGGTGPHRAVVRWTKAGEVGLGFLRPLPKKLFETFQITHIPDSADANTSTQFDDISDLQPQRFC